MPENVLVAFCLTLFAGLSTGIGSAFAFFWPRTSKRFLCVVLGFSAGIMIYISFVELLPDARTMLTKALGSVPGAWLATGAFFSGILFIAIIDRLIPSYENPHETHSLAEMQGTPDFRKLKRLGFFVALAIAIHNFPEGLATMMASLKDVRLGVSVAIAIALHNIPEGISVSVPIFCATGSRKKAFFLSFLSGLSEPVGAVIGYLILSPFFSPAFLGALLGGVAGIMVFISLDELFPAAREYGHGHLAIFGLIAGMAVMALSLLILL